MPIATVTMLPDPREGERFQTVDGITVNQKVKHLATGKVCTVLQVGRDFLDVKPSRGRTFWRKVYCFGPLEVK